MKNYLALFVCFLILFSFSFIKVSSTGGNLKDKSDMFKIKKIANSKIDSNIVNNFFYENKIFEKNMEVKGNCLVKIPYGNENKERFYDFKNFPQISVQNIQFNLCGDVFGNESCDSLDKTGMIVSKLTCSSYSNESQYLKKWTLNENGDILVEFPEGEICSKPGEIELNYKVSARLKCSQRKGYFVEELKGFDTCNPSIVISSHKLCDYKTYINWIDSLNINKTFLAFVIIAFGIILCFVGVKLRDFSVYSILFISLNLMSLTLVQFELEFHFMCKILFYFKRLCYNFCCNIFICIWIFNISTKYFVIFIWFYIRNLIFLYSYIFVQL